MRPRTESSSRPSPSEQLPGVLEAEPRLRIDPCRPSDQPLRSPNPEPPTHYELPWVAPGADFLDLQGRENCGRWLAGLRHRAAGGRFWHGFAVRVAACMAARGRRSRRRTGRRRGSRRSRRTTRVQRKCTDARQMEISGCSRRRTWLVSAGFRGGRSIARLHAGSCGLRGCATGFGFSPPSWSDGSASEWSRRMLPRRRRRACPSPGVGAASGRCSMTRWRAAGDER